MSRALMCYSRAVGSMLIGAWTLLHAANGHGLTLGVHPEEPAPPMAQILVELDADALPLELRSFPDQQQLVAALQNQTLDAALISAPKQPIPGVRMIADLYPSVLHVLHRDTLAGRSLADLLTSGAIWAGGPGSAGERLLQDLIADYALASEEVTVLSDPFTQAPDIWIIFGGILSNDALSRLKGYRLFAFGDTDAAQQDIAQGIVLRQPTLHTMTLPAELYPTLSSRRVTTVAANTQLVVREDLPEADAYQLASLALQARPVMAARYPFVTLDDQQLQSPAAHALPLHSGAQRFADRYEPSFLERYAEVFAFLLTMLVAIASATVAFNRYRRQRRKDRLDRFFQKLLEQRAELSSPEAAVVALANIRDLQSEVIALVVDERINADGALLAFLTLSNQLLTEYEQIRSVP